MQAECDIAEQLDLDATEPEGGRSSTISPPEARPWATHIFLGA